MIEISVSSENRQKIDDAIGKLGGGRYIIQSLKEAVNATAREARELLGETAEETYDFSGDLSKGPDVKNATAGDLTAHLKSSGPKYGIETFSVSYGDDLRARVLKHSGMKPVSKHGNKAFAVQFRSGHRAVAVRTGKARLPIEAIMALALPQMYGSQRVYGEKADEIGEILNRHIAEQLDKVL
jgi:hypothetical protein